MLKITESKARKALSKFDMREFTIRRMPLFLTGFVVTYIVVSGSLVGGLFGCYTPIVAIACLIVWLSLICTFIGDVRVYIRTVRRMRR